MDVILVILPKIEADAPTVGAPLLKAILAKNGYSSKVFDFNIDLYNEMKRKGKQFEYYNHYSREFEKDYFQRIIRVEYNYMFEKWVDEIISLKPKYVGLSLLTYFSLNYAMKLSYMLRAKDKDLKIIWGGAGVDNATSVEGAKRNLAHYFVIGDGEDNIINILKGIKAPGINDREDCIKLRTTSAQLDDLSKVIVPDYSDINWSVYDGRVDDRVFKFTDSAYVTGSRGCVKRCTFCSVKEIWPKYRFRPALNIVDEIKDLVINHKRKNIKFTDSLINGSMREYRILLKELVELKKQYPEFNWDSQWILRGETQSPESDYAMMAESGCKRLDIGLEHFSEKVRYEMGKKFKNEDMWYCLDMLRKYKISSWLLMIVGYPTETEEDHQITLDSIKEYHKRGFNVGELSFGNVLNMQIGDGTWNAVKDDIVYYNSSHDWQYKDNTPELRLKRLKEVHNLIAKLSGQPVNNHGARGMIEILTKIVNEKNMATPTGIEPVISCVTGKHLNHSTKEPLLIQLS